MVTDPLTKQLFEPKRITQRFATPANRIKFYNESAKALRQQEAYVNKPLRTNHRICIELLQNSKEGLFHQQFLLGKGFSFQLITHYTDYQGKRERAIYNFIWIAMDNDQIKIIKLK
jgi:hypothetical protein